MPPANKAYLDTVKRQFKITATWPPGSLVKVGDVGVLRDGAFVPQTTLRQMGVPFRDDERRRAIIALRKLQGR